MPDPSKPAQNPPSGQAAKPAAKPAPTPAESADPAMAALFSGGVHAQMAPCPSCGILLKPGTTICVGCGFHLDKGKALKTRVIAAPADHAKAKAVGGAAVAAAQLTAGAMAPLFWIAGAVMGGGLGAAAWAGVAYSTHREFGWIAIVVGLFTGVGASLFAQHRAGLISGVIAAAVAICAMLGGRYAAIQWVIDENVQKAKEMGAQVPTDVLLAFIADDVATEKEKQGKSLVWPSEDGRPPLPQDLSDYPTDVTLIAQERWGRMKTEEKQNWRGEVEKRLKAKVAETGFVQTLTIFHILYWLLGAGVAFSSGAKSLR